MYNNYNTVIAVIVLFGAFLRLYNLNFEDFWYDEMVSYWLSDPKNNFLQTLDLIFQTNLTLSYELILKYFHYFFGYDVKISRYLNSILSILSLFYFLRLMEKNIDEFENKKIIIYFGLILLTLNIFHIRYAMEVRGYTLTFLLSLIYFNLIFKNKLIIEKISILRYVGIFFISLFLLFSHAFSLIIIFSVNFYIFLLYFFKKKNSKEIFYIFCIIVMSASFFCFFYFNSINHIPFWINQLKPSFFTNFFFSNFFGSRLVGSIYLITIIIILKFYLLKIIKRLDINFFFLILIFFTYMIPIIYSYLLNPILIPRYIFFVLIPVLFLISNFSFKIKNKILKRFIIMSLISFTFFNHFTENTFKQIYRNIYPSKPEIGKTLKYINQTDVKKFTFLKNKENSFNINTIYSHYLNSYANSIDEMLILSDYEIDNIEDENIWILYITDITNQKKFKKPGKFDNYVIESEKNFNHVQLKLLKKNGT